ncbi:unnamed protein product [Schistosoma bovis]|nr:unnamed protein product [Schistosoma bovis]
MVTRGAAALDVGTTRSADISSGLVGGGSAASKPRPSNNSPHSYRSPFTKVPFLMEKLFDGDKELCSYFSNEVIPGSGNHPNSLMLPLGRGISSTSQCNTLDSFKTHSLPLHPQFANRSTNDLYSPQSYDHGVPFSPSSRVGDGSNVFNIDKMSPSSSIYHTDGEITHAISLVHHSPFKTLSNQSLISGIVTDIYHIGNLLQALLKYL